MPVIPGRPIEVRRHEISDAEWDLIQPHLPGRVEDPGRTARDHRGCINAVLWMARTGAPWRDLPERLGPWNSVFQRFNSPVCESPLGDRWCKRGVWARLLETWKDPDLECLMLDSSVIRAHPHAAGALKKGAKSKPSDARAGG